MLNMSRKFNYNFDIIILLRSYMHTCAINVVLHVSCVTSRSLEQLKTLLLRLLCSLVGNIVRSNVLQLNGTNLLLLNMYMVSGPKWPTSF